MNFHWFNQEAENDIDYLKELSIKLDNCGYKSVLLVFYSKASDNWIKAARIVDPNKNLKYMIAIRPYIISPTYCAMMINGFNDIAPNKLVLNIVSGQILDAEDEPDPVIGNIENISTSEDRKQYLIKFLDKLMGLEILHKKPNIVVGTRDQFVTDEISKHAEMSLCMYDDYNNLNLNSFDKRMVAVQILIRNSLEEAEKLLDQDQDIRQKYCTFYGTKEMVIEQIKNAQKMGITDLLISPYSLDENIDSIHELVYELSKVDNHL